jgi:hypothetical protein
MGGLIIIFATLVLLCCLQTAKYLRVVVDRTLWMGTIGL